MKAAAGSEAQHRFALPGHPRALADCNFSLGSAEVGAALSSPPTPGSGEWGGKGSMSRAEPKGERLLKRLKNEIVRGGRYRGGIPGRTGFVRSI